VEIAEKKRKPGFEQIKSLSWNAAKKIGCRGALPAFGIFEAAS
jgi:hypothetical protein